MKKIILIFCFATIAIVVFTTAENAVSYTNGAPVSSTNAPEESTCATNFACHSGIPNAGSGGTILVSMEDISNGYIGGATYTIMPFVNQSGSVKTGFQTVALLANGQGAGSVTIINSKTQVNTADAKEYVTHTASGTMNVGMHDWMYEWTAPLQGSGTVTIYGAFIASNNDMTASGDSIYTDSLVIPENTTRVQEFEIYQLPFTIYPALVRGELTVNYYSKEIFSVEYFIYSASGKLFENGFFSFCAEKNSLKINCSNYSNGLYLISIKGKYFQKALRFLKM